MTFTLLKYRYWKIVFIVIFLSSFCLLNSGSSSAQESSISGFTPLDPDCEFYDEDCDPPSECDFEPWGCDEPRPEPECDFSEIDCDPRDPELELHPPLKEYYNE